MLLHSRGRGARVVAVFAVVLSAAVGQAATVQLRGSEADARLVGPTEALLRGIAPLPIDLPAGDWAVHFGTDADGKPESLRVSAPAGAAIRLAVQPAAAAATRPFAAADPAFTVHWGGNQRKASWQARCIGAADARDYRVTARVSGTGAAGGVGLVARWTDVEHHYRLVWDRERSELRLERQLGGHVLVLAKAPSPPVDEREHLLALQVQGFSVQGFCDEELVVKVFDGAFQHGAAGAWFAGDAVKVEQFAIEPPASPRPSSALVASDAGFAFVGATAATAGHFYVIELALDRPHPLLPRNEAGSEPWLLQRPAAPRVLLADWRASLGRGTLGLVPRNGLVHAELAWPDTIALRRQAVLVAALIVSPDGEAVVGQTPPVRLGR